MKKILQISALFLVAFLSAQNVSAYQYIYVPAKFTEFEPNQYRLNDLVISTLSQKKYIILKDDRGNWPADVLRNPCQVLTADLRDTSSMFKNKTTFQVKDCQNKTIFATEGSTLIKEFDAGMRQAFLEAAKKIPLSAPQEMLFSENTPVSNVGENAGGAAPAIDSSVAAKAQFYTNGKITLSQIFLANGEFILADLNGSVPFATFKPATKKEVFHVKLPDGTMTIGYFENNSIVLDRFTKTGTYEKEIFTAAKN